MKTQVRVHLHTGKAVYGDVSNEMTEGEFLSTQDLLKTLCNGKSGYVNIVYGNRYYTIKLDSISYFEIVKTD